MNDNETIKVTAELDASASQRQIKTALSDIQKGLSPIKTAISVDTSAAKKQLQDVQKQFAALSASAKSASDAQQSFWKSAQGTGRELTAAISAVSDLYTVFPSLKGISTEYALFPQAA